MRRSFREMLSRTTVSSGEPQATKKPSHCPTQETPLDEVELVEARRTQEKIQQDADSFIAKITASTQQIPSFMELGAERIQRDLDDAKRHVRFIETQLEEARLSSLDRDAYRAALKDFKTTFIRMDPHMQKNMMGYFINRMEQEDQEVRIWMRGDNPEAAEGPTRAWLRAPKPPRKKEPPTERYSVGGEWLPLADLNCGPSD